LFVVFIKRGKLLPKVICTLGLVSAVIGIVASVVFLFESISFPTNLNGTAGCVQMNAAPSQFYHSSVAHLNDTCNKNLLGAILMVDSFVFFSIVSTASAVMQDIQLGLLQLTIQWLEVLIAVVILTLIMTWCGRNIIRFLFRPFFLHRLRIPTVEELLELRMEPPPPPPTTSLLQTIAQSFVIADAHEFEPRWSLTATIWSTAFAEADLREQLRDMATTLQQNNNMTTQTFIVPTTTPIVPVPPPPVPNYGSINVH
jgi:hypothetical protein